MLIPRFSLRMLLIIMTGSGVLFSFMTLAARGHVWAVAITSAVMSVVVAFVVYMSVFALAWGLAMVGQVFRSKPTARSPFASATLPPQQIIPPEDTE